MLPAVSPGLDVRQNPGPDARASSQRCRFVTVFTPPDSFPKGFP